MRVMVTGGAGYIGSHTMVELLGRGHEALVVDCFANSSPVALDRVRELTNGYFETEKCDIRDTTRLAEAARRFRPQVVIHFAGLKSVGESACRALDYYDVNVTGTLSLLRAMEALACTKIIFSSSATVYGEAEYLPYDEQHRIAPTNVYGQTKAMAEQVLSDWARQGEGRAAILLRYFNPVGAHASGRIGENPQGVPENLMPFMAQVATGRHDALRIWGDDYPTPDGTGIRDYIHVTDLARAHVAAIDRFKSLKGSEAYNIGTGQGVSVKGMLAAFERVVGRAIPSEIHPRRPGDVAESRADASKANRELGWRAEFIVDDMVQSLWAWQSANPEGYEASPKS